MAIRGGYAPPGVYTQSVFESPTPDTTVSGRVPLFIGTGRETVVSNGLTLVRGSSATIDQQIVEEDMTSRAVLGTNPDGSYILGDFDSNSSKVRTKLWPIVTGDGTGTVTNSPSSVSATINGNLTVVLSVDGANGIVSLAEAPKNGDIVYLTYYFDRNDTSVVAEDLSGQITTERTALRIVKTSTEDYSFTGTTNILQLIVDGAPVSVTLPLVNTARTDNLARAVVAINTTPNIGTLEAAVFTDNYGVENLELTADGSIIVGAGSANGALGLFQGQTGSARKVVFFTNYSPITDGTGAGAVTTSVADVEVSLDGEVVIPSAVDGATGAITLADAPKVGSTLTVNYSFNPYKDQFDYVPARGVREITRVSDVATGSSPATLYTEGVNWVLKDDKILWGSAVLPSAVEGSSFPTTKVIPSNSDDRMFLAECAPHVINGRIVANTFKLPAQPVDGTGTGTPTSRTDLVKVKTGYTLADALERSDVLVSKVNPQDSSFMLTRPVPAGHKVFATFYYNLLQTESMVNGGGYELTSVISDRSGVGSYRVKRGADSLYGVRYTDKGSDLAVVKINFPSGSELLSDARIEGGIPVEETVTVEFKDFNGTPALYTAPGFGPYLLGSLSFVLDVDNTTLNPIALDDSLNKATIVGEPIEYTVASSGQTRAFDGTLLLEVDGQALSVSVNNPAGAVGDLVTAINTASQSVEASYTAMSAFGSESVTIVVGDHDDLAVSYVGITGGGAVGRTDVTITVPPDTYTAGELAQEIEDLLKVAFNGVISDAGADTTSLEVVADSLGRMKFTLTGVAVGDEYGYIEFVEEVDDLAQVIGVDVDSADGKQSKFGILPVADFVSTDTSDGDGNFLRDRLILRSRFVAGERYVSLSRNTIEVVSGGDLAEACGLVPGTISTSTPLGRSLDVLLTIDLGWEEMSGSLAGATFYDGSGTQEANNILSLTVNGASYNIDLLEGNANNTKRSAQQIADLIDSEIGTTSVVNGNLIHAHLPVTLNAYIEVGEGIANERLSLTAGDTFTTQAVSADALSSAFNSHIMQGGALGVQGFMFSENIKTVSAALAGNYLTSKAITYLTQDSSGRSYISFESLNVGIDSIITFKSSTGVNEIGSGLRITAGDSVIGEAPYQGFLVTSDNPAGSGSANTSSVSATGSDGVVGQTYVDSVTGLHLTILAREGGQNYPTGVNARLTFVSSKTILTNNTLPVRVIPGVSLLVENTTGVTSGDTVFVETFANAGDIDVNREPSIGSVYYLDIVREKSVFGTAVFTRISDVIAEFGDISPQNSLTMAAYYAFINGASAIALKQVPLLEGETELTTSQILDSISEIEGEIVPSLSPSIIVPLVPANDAILSEISRHCDIQSSLRYRSERTAILGFSAGTQPKEAQRLASITKNSRVRLVYPDIVSSTVTNVQGVSQTYLLDGRYLAVALASATTAGTIDVATPWTSLQVLGFNTLSRNLDAVDANQTANSGVTVLQQRGGQIVVRHGLTTDMDSVLSKTPTVIQIADEVHLRARNLTSSYIGQKFVPSVLNQIQGRVSEMFRRLVSEQIINDFTGISVVQDPEDPTGILIEAYYQPMFPLLYIQFTFNVRSSV